MQRIENLRTEPERMGCSQLVVDDYSFANSNSNPTVLHTLWSLMHFLRGLKGAGKERRSSDWRWKNLPDGAQGTENAHFYSSSCSTDLDLRSTPHNGKRLGISGSFRVVGNLTLASFGSSNPLLSLILFVTVTPRAP